MAALSSRQGIDDRQPHRFQGREYSCDDSGTDHQRNRKQNDIGRDHDAAGPNLTIAMAAATIVIGPEDGFADGEIPVRPFTATSASASSAPRRPPLWWRLPSIRGGAASDIRPDHPMPIYSFRLHAFDRAYPPLPQVGFL